MQVMKMEYEKLGVLLYRIFFYNHSAYAIQEEVDGEVCFFTKHQRIDANKINYYIDKKNSILAYQQNFDKLNWVCLDFDIIKNVIDNIKNYDFITDDKYKKILIEEVKLCCEYLDGLNISYLLEYSGNRGIHLWMFFASPITKRLGYTIIEKIVDNVPFKYINKFDSPIAIDLFPKVPSSKNNIVGKGVKIPVSFHLKSRSYSYIIEDINKIQKVQELTEDFILIQISKLEQVKNNDVKTVVGCLKISELSDYREYERVNISLDEKLNENDLIKMLSKSALFKYLFDNMSSLGENERRILVGTFARIEYDGDPEYGLKLLKQIFSNSENYDVEKTDIKINLLKNLYPPNIAYIEKTLGQKCIFCESKGIKNVTELIDNITLRNIDYLTETVDWAVKSEINYLNFNDEVPLSFIEDELNDLELDTIESELKRILDEGIYNHPVVYKYERSELEKTRILYSMSGKDRVITTSLMKYIYDVIGVDSISPISYSYRINTNSRTNIFMNWNTLWMEFIKAVQSCANHEAYDDYYVIKLDIKSFYNSIDMALLKEIITAKSNTGIQSDFIKLSIESLSPEMKLKYNNAVNYLINTCNDISGNIVGVPQGPAYARYLAELYLAAFDEFLNLQLDPYYDFACRYVDDYYIFIKNQIKGEKIKDLLISELSKMYLEVNSKLKYGILKDIKYEIEVKNHVEKYFIDGVDEGTPVSVKYEAKRVLSNMYREFIDNEDIKDFPFFLTHLLDEEELEKRSNELISKVTSLEIGRGSLFKHFYNRVATKFSNMDFYPKINGLSRANFITSLMRNECVNFTEKKELVETFLLLDLKDYERRELLRYILTQGIEFSVDILKKEDYKNIIELLKHIQQIHWTENLFKKILLQIQDIEDKSDSLMILERVLSNSSTIPNNDYFIKTVYAVLRENNFEGLQLNRYQKLFNLIAYATLFLSKTSQVKEIWNKLLANITEGIQTNQWLKYTHLINVEKIKSSTVTWVLTQIFSNYSFIDNEVAKPIEIEFAYYLFLELSNYSNKETYISNDLYALVKKVAEEKEAVSLLWCCDNAEYYLDRKISAKNIEYNDRLVLIKGNQILVRGDKKCFDNDSYLEEKLGAFINKCYKIYPIENTLTNYNEMVHEKDILDAFKCSYEIIEQINKNLVNIFEKGSLTKEKSGLNFTFSRADKKFVLSETESIDVNVESVIENMIETIAVSKGAHTFEPMNYVLGDKKIKECVVPNKFFSKNRNAKVEYYRKLCKYVFEHKVNKSDETISIYDFEGYKISALGDVVQLLEKELSKHIQEMSSNFKVLALYNKLYSNNSYCLLYSKIDNRSDELQERINFFIESVSHNLDCKFVKDIIIDIKRMTNSFKIQFGEMSDYKKISARQIDGKNQIVINDERKAVNEFEIYYFDGKFEKCDFEQDDLISLNYEDMFLKDHTIFILPEVFTKSYEIAYEKDDRYDLKKINKTNVIKSYSYFDDAVKIIIQQSGGYLSREVAENRIIEFLRDKDTKYYDTVLEIISSYKVISNDEYQIFKDKLIELLKKAQISTIPLKNYVVDRNGLQHILCEHYQEYFGRGKECDKIFNTSIKNFFSGKGKDTIAFVSDVGVSGKQFIKTLDDYLNKKESYNKDVLFKYENDIFKDNLDKAKKIIILNCVYTNVYKKEITNYFSAKFNFLESDISFYGTEIDVYNEYAYKDIHQKKRLLFKEFIQTYYPQCLVKKMYTGSEVKYEEYIDIVESNHITEIEFCKTLMLLRYKSLPKYHHIIFDNTIFDYRKE